MAARSLCATQQSCRGLSSSVDSIKTPSHASPVNNLSADAGPDGRDCCMWDLESCSWEGSHLLPGGPAASSCFLAASVSSMLRILNSVDRGISRMAVM